MQVLRTISFTQTLRRCETTGVVSIFEEWLTDGKRDRADGPASLLRDPATGIVTREAWWSQGKLGRIDGPAVIRRSELTGLVTREAWYIDNVKHREDAPAVIERDAGTGAMLREEWWVEGTRMAEPKAPLPICKPSWPGLVLAGPL